MGGPWCKGIDSAEGEQYLNGKSRDGGYGEAIIETGMRMRSLSKGEWS